MKHVIIGDVHGRWQALTAVLAKLGIVKGEEGWENPNGYFVVQLGDLNDYGILDREYSSVKCFEIMMELQEAGIAQVLYSNHHDKLMRYLKGNKIKPSHGLENTIEEIKKESMDYQGELFLWLSKLPLHYKFEENGQKYICSHAYFDAKLERILAEDNLIDLEQLTAEPRKPNEYLRATSIYGPRTSFNGTERVIWWEDEAWIAEKFNPEVHYFVAHLHTFKIHKQFHILDSDNALVAYIPSEDRYIGVKK